MDVTMIILIFFLMFLFYTLFSTTVDCKSLLFLLKRKYVNILYYMLKGNTLKNGQLNPQKDVQEDTSGCSEELMTKNKETTSDKEDWPPGKI